MKCNSRSCIVDVSRGKYCSQSCSARESALCRGEKTQLDRLHTCERSACQNQTVNELYCSKSCAAKVNNAKHPKRLPAQWKSCMQCAAQTTNQKFCSKICTSIYKRELRINLWLSGKIAGGTERGAARWAREYVLNEANYACEVCGWNECNPVTNLPVLAVDHINGKRHDNRRENLKALCLNHHGLTPTFGFLNSEYMRNKLQIEL